MNSESPLRYAFFGSSQFSVYILDEMEKAGILPAVVITTPPKPVGRKLVVTPTVVSVWATSRSIPVLTPEKLDNIFVYDFKHHSPIVSVVASYGKIIPKDILEIPRYKTLNIHPSLLPLYRGATPIQSAILDDQKSTGVSIMQLDELMDHGPILARQSVVFDEWPVYDEAEEMLARVGGKLLSETIPMWVAGSIVAEEQDHTKATYTRKISKENGQIELDGTEIKSGKVEGKKGREIFLKSKAYAKWPTVFFIHKNKRVKITECDWSSSENLLTIKSVVPEGRNEIGYSDYISQLIS